MARASDVGETGLKTERDRALRVGPVEWALVLWRYRIFVLGLCAAVLVATFVITKMLPKVYESTTTLLAPREGHGGWLLGSLAASNLVQQLPGLSPPSMTPNRDMLVNILKSRTLAGAVVERFMLRERYRLEYVEDAIRAFQGATKISISREGAISVTVQDTDPEMAAQIANYAVEQIDRLLARYGIGEAGRQRVFLTEQLARAKATLDGAEGTLRRFQERHRAVALQEQTRGAVEAAARLQGEIMAAEVQLQVMRGFATEANPELTALVRRIDEMKRQLAKMHYGDTRLTVEPALSRDRRDFIVPLPRVPEVGLELGRLMREVKVHETLVTLLAQQLEQVKMAEAKDLPVVQVLDRAVRAERPSWPRLRLNLAVAGAVSVILGVALALTLDYMRHPHRGMRVT